MHDSRPGSQSLTSLPGRDVVTRREPEDIAQLASRRDSLPVSKWPRYSFA